MTNIEIINNILEKNNGIIKTEDLKEENIARHYLKILQEKGEIIKLDRGIYARPDVWEDEMYILQAKYKKSIFSHETALFLHELTDRTPIYYRVTIPNNYNPKNLKYENVKLNYSVNELLEIGVIEVTTSYGNYVRCYDKEKTICDIIRNKENENIEVVTDALKMYVSRRDKDLQLLMKYATVLKIEKKVREYMEILI